MRSSYSGFGGSDGCEVHHQPEFVAVPHLVVAVQVAVHEHGRTRRGEHGVGPVAPAQDGPALIRPIHVPNRSRKVCVVAGGSTGPVSGPTAASARWRMAGWCRAASERGKDADLMRQLERGRTRPGEFHEEPLTDGHVGTGS